MMRGEGKGAGENAREGKQSRPALWRCRAQFFNLSWQERKTQASQGISLLKLPSATGGQTRGLLLLLLHGFTQCCLRSAAAAGWQCLSNSERARGALRPCARDEKVLGNQNRRPGAQQSSLQLLQGQTVQEASCAPSPGLQARMELPFPPAVQGCHSVGPQVTLQAFTQTIPHWLLSRMLHPNNLI